MDDVLDCLGHVLLCRNVSRYIRLVLVPLLLRAENFIRNLSAITVD